MAPDHIRCHDKKGFARETLEKRLPKILGDARSAMEWDAGRDSRWEPFLENMIAGGPIALDMLTRPTPFWSNYIERLAGKTWRDLSFFEIEFIFYHAINSRAGWFETGFDVFAATRASALREALPRFERALGAIKTVSGVERLRVLVRRATRGNAADCSQTSIVSDPWTHGEPLLVDDSEDLLAVLAGVDHGEIHVLADNAGAELCWDLALIDALLSLPMTRVVLHLKPWPMFVSDALGSDAQNCLAALTSKERSEDAQAVGRRLRAALSDDRLHFEASPDWGEPRHISGLDPELRRRMAKARSIIVKGDLNYRRFVEDRAWSPDAPVEDATVATDMSAFALRVLKSDAVVGIPSQSVSALRLAEPNWRSGGRYAVVQALGKAPTEPSKYMPRH